MKIFFILFLILLEIALYVAATGLMHLLWMSMTIHYLPWLSLLFNFISALLAAFFSVFVYQLNETQPPFKIAFLFSLPLWILYGFLAIQTGSLLFFHFAQWFLIYLAFWLLALAGQKFSKRINAS